MAVRDPRVDAYIAKSAEFAQPILRHLREVVHAACPDVEETIKWSMPSFTHAGVILCNMAAFKQHCALAFWKGALIAPPDGVSNEQAMGQFGRITKLSELPSKKILVGYIKQAMKLNEEGAKLPSRSKPAKPKPTPLAPDDLLAALKKNKSAKTTFDAFPPSCKRDYVDWITEAKRAETRERRVAQAVEWMAEGKRRNWKYANC
ncbi:MAG: YdeI/OmpD-associated family protein [Lysobacteraceae bacterium]